MISSKTCVANDARLYSIQTSLRRGYEVRQTEGILGSSLSLLSERIAARSALIVTTPTVAQLYGFPLQEGFRSHGIKVPLMVLRCREWTKTMQQVEHLCSEVYAQRLDRKSLLIGLGGGVCTDLVTMAASLIRRGISHVRIPTTLLGQVDAGIGIKGAVNTNYKKSALGCYHPPEVVFVDPSFLRTLPPRHISSGLAEMIKIALVCDRDLFQLLERNVSQFLESCFAEPARESSEAIWRSVLRMLEQLASNLYEDQTYKRLVDFGHTFSPLLEAFSGFRLSHGDAVAIDMALSCAVACELGLLDEASRDRAIYLIAASSLPIHSRILSSELCADALREATDHRGGSLNLVVPTSLGRGDFIEMAQDVPVPALKSAIECLESFTSERLAGNERYWVSHRAHVAVSRTLKARAAS